MVESIGKHLPAWVCLIIICITVAGGAPVESPKETSAASLDNDGSFKKQQGGFTFHNLEKGFGYNDKSGNYAIDESKGNYDFKKQEGTFPIGQEFGSQAGGGGSGSTYNSLNLRNKAYSYYNHGSELKDGSVTFNNDKGTFSSKGETGTLPLNVFKKMYPDDGSEKSRIIQF